MLRCDSLRFRNRPRVVARRDRRPRVVARRDRRTRAVAARPTTAKASSARCRTAKPSSARRPTAKSSSARRRRASFHGESVVCALSSSSAIGRMAKGCMDVPPVGEQLQQQ
ncbi:unnamed protein product [Closterium sp. NIES-53]